MLKFLLAICNEAFLGPGFAWYIPPQKKPDQLQKPWQETFIKEYSFPSLNEFY